MNCNSNIPAGSQNDSRAPWNEVEPILCRYCDCEEIQWNIDHKIDHLINECYEKHPDITPEYEEMIDEVAEREWYSASLCYFHSMED